MKKNTTQWAALVGLVTLAWQTPPVWTDEDVFVQAESVVVARFTGHKEVVEVTHENNFFPDGSVGPLTLVVTRYEIQVARLISGDPVPPRCFVHMVGGTLGSRVTPNRAPSPPLRTRVVLPMHVDSSPGDAGYIVLYNRIYPATTDEALVSLEARVLSVR